MTRAQEAKTCQNCRGKFMIEPEDFDFYEKIQVPPPTFCPECRRQRRMSWRNDFTLYSRTCGLCKRNIVALYAAGHPAPIYCQKCWWSDKWDPKSYGRDIDFSRPFFKQFRELQDSVPALALVNDDGIASVNCEYTQDVAFAKNCYMVFIAWRLEDCAYSVYVVKGKDLVDCLQVWSNSELIYDSVSVDGCYRCRNVYYASTLSDCAFCYDCRGCSYCFLCTGLRNKWYCFKNKEYSKEEYEKIIEGYRLDTRDGTEKAKQELLELLVLYPRRFAYFKNCVRCTGDYLTNCKNAKNCFNVQKGEDCRHVQNSDTPKDSYDLIVGGELNQCYEGITPDHSYRGLFTMFSWKNTEVTYCENVHSSKHLFGCSGIKKGEYCILNKQYAKEEYGVLRQKLIDHMKRTGEWGEFFPSRLSHFGYNETIAQEFSPLTKEEAIKKRFRWQDNLQFTTDKETLRQEDVPDSINDVDDSIMNEVLACSNCSRNYRIVPHELKLYRAMRIPIPRECFYCRHQARLKFKNPYTLWRRSCACGGVKSQNGLYINTREHFHKQDACQNLFETSYSPDRPEIVYCEQCYQTEVA